MEKDIGKITKNDRADIIIRIDDFGGRVGLTIREFVTSDRYTGFTKSGVKISGADFPKFKEIINSITEEDLKEAPVEEQLPAEQETLEQATPEQKPVEASSPSDQQKPEKAPSPPEPEKVETVKPDEGLPDY